MPSQFMSYIAAALLGLASVAAHFSECPGAQAVKINNLSSAQNFTTPIFIVHNKEISLFEWGTPASAELTSLAEEGDTSAIETFLQSADVASFVCGYTLGEAPVAPGESYYTEVPTEEKANCTCADIAMTVLSKVQWTNDAFVGINTVVLPITPWDTLDEPHAAWTPIDSPAYDAGTEANTERCIDIEGGCPNTVTPKAGPATPAARLAGEGFIHVSSGIRGTGDLDANVFDWANPIAVIELHGRLPPRVTEDDLPITVPFNTWVAAQGEPASSAVSGSALSALAVAVVVSAAALLL